jgi:two-component system NarL family sensor kinase
LSPGSESESTAHFIARLQAGDCFLRGERRGISVAELRARSAFLALLALQQVFLNDCFRLQRAERRLYERMHRPGRGGSRAIRQLELERQRLGRELHTGVGQMLAAIRLQLEIIEAQLPAPDPPVSHALQRISHLADEALGQVRSVSHRLHPPEWQRLRLEDALRQLWQISGIPESFLSDLRIESLEEEPDLEVKVLMYRTLQEALSNLVRHAGATRAELVLERRGPMLLLLIRDNGSGFDAAELFSRPAGLAGGIGLRSIREQATELGGKLIVTSGPIGTTLEVLVPFHALLSS